MAKKDFEGKSKKSTTYDQDWKFVKNKHKKGPNYSGGAWMTNQQAKRKRQEEKESKAFHARKAAERAAEQGVGVVTRGRGQDASTVPLPKGSQRAIIDTGGMIAPGSKAAYFPHIPTSPTPDTAIPDWWINQAYQNPDDQQAFANAANAILPTLAPEDQRTLGNYLATNFGDVFGGYSQASFSPIPTEIGDKERRTYLSPQRAQLALTLMDRMHKASGVQETGKGYDFLKNAVNLINQFSQGGQLSREKYNQFSNAVSSLVSGAGSDLSAYSNLAQLFNLPSFSAGPLVSNAPNVKLYS